MESLAATASAPTGSSGSASSSAAELAEAEEEEEEGGGGSGSGGASRSEMSAEALAAAEEAAARAALFSNNGSGGEAVAGSSGTARGGKENAAKDKKEAERDAAVRLALGVGKGRKQQPQTLRAALGMQHAHFITDDQVKKRARDALVLLHPDFSLNRALKGTKKHAQIAEAFKKLSALRDASESA